MLTTESATSKFARCQRLAEQTGDARVKGILLDMARTWTRLALEAERWNQENSPRAFEHRNGIYSRHHGRWLRELDRYVILSGHSAATRVFCSRPLYSGARCPGAREAGEQTEDYSGRGLIRQLCASFAPAAPLCRWRASVSAFLSQHVAGYVLSRFVFGSPGHEPLFAGYGLLLGISRVSSDTSPPPTVRVWRTPTPAMNNMALKPKKHEDVVAQVHCVTTQEPVQKSKMRRWLPQDHAENACIRRWSDARKGPSASGSWDAIARSRVMREAREY